VVMNTPDCLLYLISPPSLPDVAAFATELVAALDIGKEQVGAFQLRLKAPASATEGRLTDIHAARDMILKASEVLRPICAEYGVAFIMNDSAELARECGADGVHLGQEDGDVEHARALLGEDAILGVSCHTSRHLAMQAGGSGCRLCGIWGVLSHFVKIPRIPLTLGYAFT
jgi:thiamine-phosphate pyrophosphorylase